MRKALILFSISTFASSLACAEYGAPSAETTAPQPASTPTTVKTTKETKEIKKHHHKQHMIYREEAAKPKDQPATATSWLDNLSGSMAFLTNYVFRGISQTSNLPAVQGSLTYQLPIGLYFNLWSSNDKYLVPNGAMATVEMDTTIGWRGSVSYFSYDINMIRYNYPGARYGNYNEFIALLTLSVFQLGIGYTENYAGFHGRGLYTNGTITIPIPPKYLFNVEGVSIAGEFGHYALSNIGGHSYNDWSATLSKQISKTYTVAFQWTDTNGRAKLHPWDGNQYIGSVTASF